MSEKGDESVKVGIAMIARNAEELMPLALEPFAENGVVDAIGIVLGGVSDDNTAEVAEKYATLPVEQFEGPVDERGRLLSFAMARQQSFDLLKRHGFDWALVVDTDDQWTGVERLRKIAKQAASNGFPMVMFPYHYQDGGFVQPRLYQISSGHWEGACHNFFEFHDIPRRAMQTDLLRIVQERGEKIGKDRREQNIEISKRWMEEHGDNCRLLQHMAKDLMVDNRLDEAEDALDRYFVRFEESGKQDPEEYHQALYVMGAIQMMRGNYEDALLYAIRAIAARSHAQSFVLAAEAAGWLSKHSRDDKPLLHLSKFFSEMAMSIGKARQNLHWQSDKLTGAVPMLLKGRALLGLGRNREALGTLDLAHMLDPEDETVTALRKDVARMMGELV
jgi:tetratricopeptide (TPR) repeat protein